MLSISFIDLLPSAIENIGFLKVVACSSPSPFELDMLL